MWQQLAVVGLLSTASLAQAATPAPDPAVQAVDREEEVSFDDEPKAVTAPRVSPEAERLPWLLLLPLFVLVVLGWNVRWRRGEVSARYAAPIGGRRAPKGRLTGEPPAEDF